MTEKLKLFYGYIENTFCDLGFHEFIVSAYSIGMARQLIEQKLVGDQWHETIDDFDSELKIKELEILENSILHET
jgi:hypothetical protein